MIRLARQWWTQSHPSLILHSQNKLLQHFVKSFVGTSSSDILNSVEFRANHPATTNTTKLPIVILAHGFGSGLGFFYNNVQFLLESQQVDRVVLVDWLGMGGSDRPACWQRPIRWNCSSFCDSTFTPSQAVDFFIEPFHRWLTNKTTNQANLEASKDRHPVWLVGHSLGGYLAARYALQYPNVLDKLIMASPVGFPSKPVDALPTSELSTSLRLLDALWSSNVTPQQWVRLLGYNRGRALVDRALGARLPHLNQEEVTLLGDYLYHITVAHPSGEFAMNSLLEPVASPNSIGVYAREPLQERIQDLQTTTKVIYGEQDWMRPNNEESARRALQTLQRRGVSARVDILPQSGHHLYLEHPKEFVRYILN